MTSFALRHAMGQARDAMPLCMARPPNLPMRAVTAWFSVAAFLTLWLAPSEAAAYATMLRHRYQGCGTCHADPSGGETLTPYGRMQGELLLRTRYGHASQSTGAKTEATTDVSNFDDFDSFDDLDQAPHSPETQNDASSSASSAKSADVPAQEEEEPSRTQEFLWGLVPAPPELMLGGSLRMATLTRPLGDSASPKVFPMQADLYGVGRLSTFELGGSLGVARVPAGSEHVRRAQLTTAQGESLNLISRTHWLGWTPGLGWLLRVGRLNPPFGLRVPEHVFWVRSRTQTDRESDQQHGVSLAFTGDGLRGELMGIAGNYQVNPDRYRERGYSGFVELMLFEGLGVGASSLFTVAEADVVLLDNATTERHAHGLFARFVPFSRLVILAEADLLLRSRRDAGYVALLQTDLQITQGVHWLTAGEVFDAGYRPDSLWTERYPRPGNGEPRFGGWTGVNWFFWSHLDMRVELHYQEPVVSDATGSSFEILTQLHAYL